MNLRTKLLLGIGIALIVTFAVVAIFSIISMESSYRALEEKEVITTVQRAQSSLTTDQKNMQSVTRDYAAWTDTYHFARGEYSEWIATNMGNDFFERFNLQGVIVLNQSGDLVFSKGYDPEKKQGTILPGDLILKVQKTSRETGILSSSEGHYQVITDASGPLVLSSHPILTDTFEGPSSGSLHLVRKVDDRYLSDLSERAGKTVTVLPAPAILENTSFSAITAGISPDPVVVVIAESATTVAGYTPMEGLESPGAYYLKVSEPRTIYQSGQNTILTFILSLLGAAVFIIAFVLLLIDRIVLSRLNTIISTVRKNKDAEAPGG
ncbi:MAG: hypothetical protein GYA23_07785, partial [Methanomicrobiales archaeon]|nr:hypothetical protein [Methanomicrobiales archaeon]